MKTNREIFQEYVDKNRRHFDGYKISDNFLSTVNYSADRKKIKYDFHGTIVRDNGKVVVGTGHYAMSRYVTAGVHKICKDAKGEYFTESKRKEYLSTYIFD